MLRAGPEGLYEGPGRRILIPRFGLEEWIAREAGLPQPPPVVVSSLPQRH